MNKKLNVVPISNKAKKVFEKAAKIGLMIQKIDIAILCVEKVLSLQNNLESLLGTEVKLDSEEAKELKHMHALSGYAAITYMWCFTQGKGYRVNADSFIKNIHINRRLEIEQVHKDIKKWRDKDLAHHEGVQSTTAISYSLDNNNFSYNLKPDMQLTPNSVMFKNLLLELKHFLENGFESTNNQVLKDLGKQDRDKHYRLVPE
jgi:hypothetical protein